MATIALAVLGGAAVKGQAATTQQVNATLTCQPATVKPGRTVGCTLTVSNLGGNNVTKLVVKDEAAPGGMFLSSSSSLCTGVNTGTLSCDIGKLTAVGTAGSTFTETHELQVPSSGGSLVQTVTGKFSPKPNQRASDTIEPVTLTTTLDPSPDYDGTFANVTEDTVQTGGAISADNPYTTKGIVFGGVFGAGLSVREVSEGLEFEENCPNGCFGGQVIEFNITPLDGVSFPESFTLTWQVVVPNGTKAGDIVVRHDGVVQSLCPDTDPCVSITIDPSTKIATFEAQRPGDENGGWGSS